MEENDSKISSLIQTLILGFFFLILIYLLGQRNYLLYHSIVELLSIAVAWSVFLLVWSTRKISGNNTFLFLGIAYLFIGFIDLIHTLSYKGMNVFLNIESSDTATQIWIAARILEAVSLSFLPVMIQRKTRVIIPRLLLLYFSFTAIVLSVIFYTDLFPRCFIEGQGLTLFKTLTEYLISLLLLFSMWRLYKYRNEMDAKVFVFTMAAFALSILSELAFTIYTDVYGISNALGHFLKLVSFGLIFQAIVQISAYRPFSTIFQGLKKDTEELTISHALHSSLIANISDVLVVLDEASAIKYLSPNITDLFGWPSQPIKERSIWEHIHPDDIEALKNSFSRLINEKGNNETVQLQYKCSDGHYTAIEMTGRNLLDDPSIRGILINFHDISERLISARELQNSEERFRALHNASFGGIVIHDKGLIIECNQGLSEITGYEYNELIGMNGLKLITEGTRDLVMNKIKEGYEKAYEARGCRKNGEEYPLRLEARNIPYKGKTVRVVEFRDISKEKEAEEEKNKLKENLIQIHKMETVGRLAGGIAHDFNNMLGVIQGYTEIIMEQENPESKNYEYLNEIKSATQRSAALTRQLLAFARKQIINRQRVDLNETIAPMIEMLDKLSGEEIELHWNPGRVAGKTYIDSNQLNQILVNLCIRAKDYMAGRGKIRIETGQKFISEEECAQWEGCNPGNYTVLAVSDNGPILDDEYRAHIFEPFFNMDYEKTGYSNLSMAAVYGCVRQNGGYINLQTEAGTGNIFTIYLPRTEE